MGTIKAVFNAVGNVLGTFFSSDSDVMSEEAKRILSNEEDRKIFFEAIDKMKNSDSHKETLILSNKEKITLFS